MNSLEAVERQSYLKREDAFAVAAKLAEVGVYVDMHGARRGWRLTLQWHTDLANLCKVLDTFEIGDAKKPLHALYRPFGSDSHPDVVIYAGSRP